MDWYYVDGDQQVGPLGDEQFEQVIQAGKVEGNTLVWHEGMPDWMAYDKVVGGIAGTGAAGTAQCHECGDLFNKSMLISTHNVFVCDNCHREFIKGEPIDNKKSFLEQAQLGGQGSALNSDIMAHARTCLDGKWGTAIGLVLLYWVISSAASSASSIIPIVGSLLPLAIMGPLELGMTRFFLATSRDQEAEIGMLFGGVQQFGTALGALLWRSFLVLLWGSPFLVLSIGGIIWAGVMERPEIAGVASVLVLPAAALMTYATYMYVLVFHIIADDPEIGVLEAARLSRRIMDGMKFKYFCLQLQFIGWALLSVLTCCIGFLWLSPYMLTSTAAFYDDVKGRALTG